MNAAHFAIGCTVAALLIAANARGAVLESNAQGFAIEEKAEITASPDRVYEALTHPEKWWNPAHTFSHDAKNLSLMPTAGSCLCETLPDGGSIEHLSVIRVVPGQMLRMKGAMGPFQGQGLEGALTFTLARQDDSTSLTLDYNIGGFIRGGFGKFPEAGDAMAADLVARLKRYVETGTPDTAGQNRE